MRKSARSYAGLSLVVGLVSIAIGGGYWYWDYQRQKRIDGEKKTPPAPPMAAPAPRAQTLPVAAPTHDLILSVQHALNSVFGWHPGDPHFLSEDGSAGPRTVAALKLFQKNQGMVPTGKIDAMTQAMLRHGMAALDSFEHKPTYAFELRWHTEMQGGLYGRWTVRDSLGFVVDIPGYNSHAYPPPEPIVVEALREHYGPSSTIGKALTAHDFVWSCADCMHDVA